MNQTSRACLWFFGAILLAGSSWSFQVNEETVKKLAAKPNSSEENNSEDGAEGKLNKRELSDGSSRRGSDKESVREIEVLDEPLTPQPYERVAKGSRASSRSSSGFRTPSSSFSRSNSNSDSASVAGSDASSGWDSAWESELKSLAKEGRLAKKVVVVQNGQVIKEKERIIDNAQNKVTYAFKRGEFFNFHEGPVEALVLGRGVSQSVLVKNGQAFVNEKEVSKDVSQLGAATYQKAEDGSLWFTNLPVGVEMTAEEQAEFKAETDKLKAKEQKRRKEAAMAAKLARQRMEDHIKYALRMANNFWGSGPNNWPWGYKAKGGWY